MGASMKTCSKCGASKTLEEFPRRSAGKDGRKGHCTVCHNAYQARYRANNLAAVNARQKIRGRVYRYGITEEEYRAMLARQDGRCAICRREDDGSPRFFQVDHDPSCCRDRKTCGQCVRGIVCGHCNKIMGLAGDDADRLRSAAAYLDAWRAR